MNVIKSLFIPCVEIEYDANYIIDALYCNNIATVSKITLLPFTKNNEIFNRAYIEIFEWHETEDAYNFIYSLRNNNKHSVRLMHSDDKWWSFKINKKHNITRDAELEPYTFCNYLALNCDERWIHGTNELGEALLDFLSDSQEWNYIERELSEMHACQNMELCL